jgi:hypothetical protein
MLKREFDVHVLVEWGHLRGSKRHNESSLLKHAHIVHVQSRVHPVDIYGAPDIYLPTYLHM